MSEKKSGLFLSKKSAAPSGAGAVPAAAAAAAPLASGTKKSKDVQKRWLYVGGGLAGAMMLFVTLFGHPSGPKTRPAASKDKAPAMISVTPPNADKAAFEANFGRELEKQRQELERLKEEMARKDEQLAKLASTPASLPPGVVPPPSPQGTAPSLPSLAPPTQTPPAPGTPPAPALAPSLPAYPTAGGEGSPDPLMFEAPARASGAGGTGPGGGPGVESKLRYEKNPNAGLLVPGAFAPVALLNGLDAGTSTTTQSNPQPVLMRIADHATLPGSARYQLRSCFVLGSGYGELSSERVNIRFSRLSCVDRKNRLVLSQEVAGYLVDSDGKLGMRGTVVDRQGAKLGKAMLAGFAEGLAKALGSAQSTMTTTGTETTSLIGGSAALRAAGLSGAETATKQLAQFYLDEAKAIFPVIAVDAGRTGTIVFTSGTALNWTDGDTRYVPQVTPK